MGRNVKVVAAEHSHAGRIGTVIRVYWREGEAWVRIRSREGSCLSVPWRWTDLPRLVTSELIDGPWLSTRALSDLVRHLKDAR